MTWSNTARPSKDNMRARARAIRKAADSGQNLSSRWTPALIRDHGRPVHVRDLFLQIEAVAKEIEEVLR